MHVAPRGSRESCIFRHLIGSYSSAASSIHVFIKNFAVLVLRAEPMEESSSHSLEISLLTLENIFSYLRTKIQFLCAHFFLFVDTNFSKKIKISYPSVKTAIDAPTSSIHGLVNIIAGFESLEREEILSSSLFIYFFFFDTIVFASAFFYYSWTIFFFKSSRSSTFEGQVY